MPVIGTAGHVDHGKSTLVQALTGRDPDRWQEEKDRGLTIDLGFAWTTLPSGVDISFVDVPGHERFIKNMLAGIEAIDIAVLVVAADEGWMPQTEEHAVVLDLLGAARAVIALTKVDRVESDLAELAVLEVEERIEGLSIEGAEIIGVSAPTGVGLERLLASLDGLAATVPPTDSGRPRLGAPDGPGGTKRPSKPVSRPASSARPHAMTAGRMLSSRAASTAPVRAQPSSGRVVPSTRAAARASIRSTVSPADRQGVSGRSAASAAGRGPSHAAAIAQSSGSKPSVPAPAIPRSAAMALCSEAPPPVPAPRGTRTSATSRSVSSLPSGEAPKM